MCRDGDPSGIERPEDRALASTAVAPHMAVCEESNLADTDPFCDEHLTLVWQVRPWTTVVGVGAATPVRSGRQGDS
jgi:hypothetical protein